MFICAYNMHCFLYNYITMITSFFFIYCHKFLITVIQITHLFQMQVKRLKLTPSPQLSTDIDMPHPHSQANHHEHSELYFHRVDFLDLSQVCSNFDLLCIYISKRVYVCIPKTLFFTLFSQTKNIGRITP